MWPIKEKENRLAVHIMDKSYPLYLAVKMCRYGSLIKINPSVIRKTTRSKSTGRKSDNPFLLMPKNLIVDSRRRPVHYRAVWVVLIRES